MLECRFSGRCILSRVKNEIMCVRVSPGWFTIADERILEFVQEQDGGSPKFIADDERIQFSRPYINTRMKMLESGGFLRQVGRGTYVLTDQGEAYLAGEFDAREVGEPE